MVVRGRDGLGNFDLIEPPREDRVLGDGEMPEALRRMIKDIMPPKG